ncbi:MAG: hypothetical protein QJR07_08155, partial [Acetobacteraceae bacterium]|nr:hypothetical protein [Acetobacteraceae bacterium]
VRLAYAQAALGQSFASAKTQAENTARDTVARNQFPANQAWTDVEVNIPPVNGPNAGNNAAVEVIVRRTAPRLISSLFLTTNPTIGARGVAALTNNGPACLLANPPAGGNVTGQLLFGGSTNVQAPECLLASNSPLSNAINFTGNAATVNAEGFVSAGGCSGCNDTRVTTERGVTIGMPTENPLANRDGGLQSFVNSVGPFNSSSCAPAIFNITAEGIVISPPPEGKAYCGTSFNNVPASSAAMPWIFDPGNSTACFCFYSSNTNQSQSAVSITSSGSVVIFRPGTYVFYNSSLNINGGTVNGTGVSFVFTGSQQGGSYQAGGPNIGANATVHLSAPLDGQGHPSPLLDGILFYRDIRATNGNGQGNPVVNINGGPSVTLAGGMYFPNSYVKYSGSLDTNICSVLVGGTIEMTGNSGLNVSNCQQFGSITPMTKIVRLVE